MNKEGWRLAAEKFAGKWKNKKEVSAILVSGSYVTGNPSRHSDLDINILLRPDTTWRERGNEVIDGFLVEYFANPVGQVEAYFKKDFENGKRITAHMYATGTVLIDKDGYIGKLKKLATKYISKPFVLPNGFAIETAKYLLWDSLDNLQEVYEASTLDYDLVYYAHLQRVFNEYSEYVGFGEVKPHKVLGFISDKLVQKKYGVRSFPDNRFVKMIIDCMGEQSKAVKQKKVSSLTNYVINKMGGLDLKTFKIRSKV